MLKRNAGAVLGLGVALAMIALAYYGPSLFDDIEKKLLDARFRLRGQQPTSGQVAIVSIDTESIDEFGRWPWSRDQLAELVDRTCEAGPAVIAFDMVFSEAQREPRRAFATELRGMVNTPETRARLDALLDGPSVDEALGAAIERCGDRIVLGYYFRAGDAEHDVAEGHEVKLPQPIPVPIRSGMVTKVPTYDSIEPNLKVIAQGAKRQGFFNSISDPDGLVRHQIMVLEHRGEFYPSIVLQALQTYWAGRSTTGKFAEDGQPTFTVSGRNIPVDENGWHLLDFRGKPHTFTHVSAADILAGRPHASIEGKIVYLGVTEIGVFDVRATPMGRQFPGTEILATATDGLLRERKLHKSTNLTMISLGLVILLGLVTGVAVQRIRGMRWAFLFALFLLTTYLVANYLTFAYLDAWLNALMPLATIGTTYVVVGLYSSLAIERKAQQLRSTFQRYVSPAIVESMVANPDQVKIGGERREMSILFSDIRGFTSISEQMSPEHLVHFLNAYFTPVTDTVLDMKGTVDKYMGDCLMAFWGAPVPLEDHAELACRAAIRMGEQMDELRASESELDMTKMDAGFGVNTGNVAVGNMGSERIFDYTVIGDAVNLASRLEGANKFYGTRILISEYTWKAVKESGLRARTIDRVRLKGKKQPVEVMELIGDERLEGWDEFLKLYDEGIRLYFERKFVEAGKAFASAQELRRDDRAAELYLERSEFFLDDPPADGWDGVFEMKTK